MGQSFLSFIQKYIAEIRDSGTVTAIRSSLSTLTNMRPTMAKTAVNGRPSPTLRMAMSTGHTSPTNALHAATEASICHPPFSLLSTMATWTRGTSFSSHLPFIPPLIMFRLFLACFPSHGTSTDGLKTSRTAIPDSCARNLEKRQKKNNPPSDFFQTAITLIILTTYEALAAHCPIVSKLGIFDTTFIRDRDRDFLKARRRQL